MYTALSFWNSCFLFDYAVRTFYDVKSNLGVNTTSDNDPVAAVLFMSSLFWLWASMSLWYLYRVLCIERSV